MTTIHKKAGLQEHSLQDDSKVPALFTRPWQRQKETMKHLKRCWKFPLRRNNSEMKGNDTQVEQNADRRMKNQPTPGLKGQANPRAW